MYLQLQDGNELTIFVPKDGNKGYSVPFSFFDRLNDYEFSQTIAELLAFNPGFDLKAGILARNIRRAQMGLNPTVYFPLLESKFGDWIKRTGKKIENAFKPSESTTPIQVQTPDGQTITVQAPIKGDSQVSGIVKGVAKAFGFYTEPTPQNPYPVQSPIMKVLPFALLGLGGIVAYKLIKRR